MAWASCAAVGVMEGLGENRGAAVHHSWTAVAIAPGRGQRRAAAIRKNVRRHARDRLLLLPPLDLRLGLGLFRFPGPAPLGLAGGAMDVRLRFLHGKVGRRSFAGLATLAGGNLQN